MHDDAELTRMVEAAPEYAPPPDSACCNGGTPTAMSNLGSSARPPLLWRPFPVDLLPEPLASWTARRAEAIPCDPSR